MSARTDLTTDPDILADLLEVRRGTAFLSRKVNEIRDKDLVNPSLLKGWSRAHVIAHVGYNARALCRLARWANTGEECPMYASSDARTNEIRRGSTLQPHALRHLYDHSAISLNVEWRDTPDSAWSATVRTATGRSVPFSETLWMRLREVWIHAVDLNNGALWSDIPVPISQRLLEDVLQLWRRRDGDDRYILRDSAENVWPSGHSRNERSILIQGDLPDLLAWTLGRISNDRLSHLEAFSHIGHVEVPKAPRWI